MIGPETLFSQRLHTEKYRQPGESFDDYCVRYARTAADTPKHFRQLVGALRAQRTLPAGRQQLAVGNPYQTTAANCYVGGNIPDSMAGIMEELGNSAMTLRSGGGCGWNFGTLRPEHEPIRGLGPGAVSSGPVAFMALWHAMCGTIMSAGMRRGAMMGVLPVSHPDIMKFVRAKRVSGALTNFNVSVGITNAFMEAVHADGLFPLTFADREFARVRALDVWAAMMENTWDWAEPGVLFIDRINEMNPLGYCEKICATNPSMPAGTKVHTDLGIFPIEKLDGKQFKVKSLDGTWAPAKCFISGEDEPLLELDFGSGRNVRCTPQHKWPVLLNGRYLRARADELVVGDLIPANRNERLGNKPVDGYEYRDGLIAGMWFGNGCAGVRSDDGRAYLSFSFNRLDPELANLAASYFGVTVSEREAELTVQVTQNEKVRRFMAHIGSSLEEPKEKIPEAVWNSGEDFVAGFVDGIFSTDGCVQCVPPNTKITFTNRSVNICREVGLLLAFHGVLSVLHESVCHLDGKDFSRCDVVISHNGAKRFAKVFSLSSVRKAASLVSLIEIPCRHNRTCDHLEIKSIRQVGRAKVWDISVEYYQHVFPTEWGYTGNCGEQPLPPHGACFLLSQNVVKYLVPSHRRDGSNYEIDLNLFAHDVRASVRAVDKVIDITVYPLPQQKDEAYAKRRMGIGITGMANALEVCGEVYGTPNYIAAQERILTVLRDTAYDESCELALERGTFPLFDADGWLASGFAKTLPDHLRDKIRRYGLRNGLLLSIAPTGTISLSADNVSGGIEPVFVHQQTRLVNMPEGQITVDLDDWAFVNHGVRGRCANDVSPTEHVAVLCSAQKYIDSAVSKTINVRGAVAGNVKPGEITFDEFKGVYLQACEGGAKGCTTFNANGKRFGILAERAESTESAACTIDPETGKKSCGD